jgi:hypothetical protein
VTKIGVLFALCKGRPLSFLTPTIKQLGFVGIYNPFGISSDNLPSSELILLVFSGSLGVSDAEINKNFSKYFCSKLNCSQSLESSLIISNKIWKKLYPNVFDISAPGLNKETSSIHINWFKNTEDCFAQLVK